MIESTLLCLLNKGEYISYSYNLGQNNKRKSNWTNLKSLLGKDRLRFLFMSARFYMRSNDELWFLAGITRNDTIDLDAGISEERYRFYHYSVIEKEKACN